jgi:hypothetical protein
VGWASTARPAAANRRELLMAWRPFSGGRRRPGTGGAREALSSLRRRAGIGVDDGQHVFQIDPSNGFLFRKIAPESFIYPLIWIAISNRDPIQGSVCKYLSTFLHIGPSSGSWCSSAD